MSEDSILSLRRQSDASIIACNVPSAHAQSTTPASCTLCRHRKVKCDRTLPCGNCQRTGAVCIPYTRSRAPRGRQGGRKRKRDDGELLERLTKLEGMVKDIETQEAATGGRQEPENRNETSSDIRLSAHEHASTPLPRMARYMASSFWENLTDEINGLKEVFGGSSDDDEDWDEPTPVSGSSKGRQHTISSNRSGFIVSRNMPYDDVVHPTQHQIYTLCDIYLANVDPVFKLLHGPSLRRYLQENAPQLDSSPGPRGLEALRFAIYYAATTSLTDGECKHRIGEDRDLLLIRHRTATESALARADFVNTVEMSTLQALAIYLVAVRANDTSRHMWTLVSLAVRIAEAMGLNHETSLVGFCPFEKEMRRRLWWQICDLDTHAAIDRASKPVILADSFNTKLPLQINDEDMSLNSHAEIMEREGFTDMTFSLSCNEIFDALRQLTYVPVREIGLQQAVPQETWNKKIDTVVQFQQRVEKMYLRRLNLNHPFHWFTRMVADVVTAIMWLLVYRPLQRRPSSPDLAQVLDPGVLRLSVDILERAQQCITDPAGSPFKWLSQTYVQWHALAVTAAELCGKTEGPMVEKAWTIVEPAFTEIARHVADSDRGMLWRPIKKLMHRARGVRQTYLNSRPPASSYTGFQSGPSDTAYRAEWDLNSVTQAATRGSPYSMQGHFPPTAMPAADPFDWDPWLTAASAADATASQDQSNTDMNRNAWIDWEVFIDDVQGQDTTLLGPNAAAP